MSAGRGRKFGIEEGHPPERRHKRAVQATTPAGEHVPGGGLVYEWPGHPSRVPAVVDLEQTSLALVPVTEHLRRSLGDRHHAVMPGFHGLTEALRDWAVSDSRETPVAYVEMESHGGAGRQASVGWPWGRYRVGSTVHLQHRDRLRRDLRTGFTR